MRKRIPVGYYHVYNNIGDTMGNGRTATLPVPQHNHSASGFTSSHYHAETNHNHGVVLAYRYDLLNGGSRQAAAYTGGIDIGTDYRAGTTGYATHDHTHTIHNNIILMLLKN